MIPTIRIDLQGMRESIVYALVNDQTEIAEQVDAALKKAIENFNFEHEVKVMADRLLREAIERAIKDAIWQAQEELTLALRPKLLKALKVAY